MLNSTLENLTLQELQSNLIRQVRPDLAAFADRQFARTYSAFVEALLTDIERIISRFEMNPGLHGTKSEDQLSIDIVDGLVYMGYAAEHDAFVGGHCDISVRHPAGFLWLGEAKIHGPYGWLSKGFSQLSDRYAPGTPNADQGGLIIYIPNKDALSVMNSWVGVLHEHALTPTIFSNDDCRRRKGLAFYSTHVHPSSGLPFTVRHMGIVLHFKPSDAKSKKT